MEQFKRAKVIMLPTDKITENILILSPNNYLSNRKDSKLDTDWYNIREKRKFKFQYLYIISDDEIREDDYFMSAFYSYVLQNTKEWRKQQKQLGLNANIADLKFHKIIATTDTSLTINTYYEIEGNQKINLPQPSQKFIEKYIESYNKGEVITDVLVEYTEGYGDIVNNEIFTIKQYLKVNPKDNTITIKKLKDSWNREEVVKLLNEIYNLGYNSKHSEIPDLEEMMEMDNWIKNNLN